MLKFYDFTYKGVFTIILFVFASERSMSMTRNQAVP